MANNSNMQFWTLETKEKRMNLRKRCFESMLSRSTVTQMFGYQSLQIRYLDMTKVRIWGAGIETTSASLSRWRCSCCAWEERWCTARVGEKGRMKGRHDRSDGEWRECGVHCEGVPHAAGADWGGVEVWEGGVENCGLNIEQCEWVLRERGDAM